VSEQLVIWLLRWNWLLLSRHRQVCVCVCMAPSVLIKIYVQNWMRYVRRKGKDKIGRAVIFIDCYEPMQLILVSAHFFVRWLYMCLHKKLIKWNRYSHLWTLMSFVLSGCFSNNTFVVLDNFLLIHNLWSYLLHALTELRLVDVTCCVFFFFHIYALSFILYLWKNQLIARDDSSSSSSLTFICSWNSLVS
jgi:hypothetical protein